MRPSGLHAGEVAELPRLDETWICDRYPLFEFDLVDAALPVGIQAHPRIQCGVMPTGSADSG